MALCCKLLAIFHVRILTLGLQGKPNDLNLLVYYWTNKRTVDMFGRKIRLKNEKGNHSVSAFSFFRDVARSLIRLRNMRPWEASINVGDP